jgi:hypothetical protein
VAMTRPRPREDPVTQATCPARGFSFDTGPPSLAPSGGARFYPPPGWGRKKPLASLARPFFLTGRKGWVG